MNAGSVKAYVASELDSPTLDSLTVTNGSTFNNDTSISSLVSIKRKPSSSTNYACFNILGNNCTNAAGASKPEVLEVIALHF